MSRIWMLLFKDFYSLELGGPNMFQHDSFPVHKVKSMRKWFARAGVDKHECPAQSPDLNPNEHLLEQLECDCTPDLPNALVAE